MEELKRKEEEAELEREKADRKAAKETGFIEKEAEFKREEADRKAAKEAEFEREEAEFEREEADRKAAKEAEFIEAAVINALRGSSTSSTDEAKANDLKQEPKLNHENIK